MTLTKYSTGDLVVINKDRKFPVVLRDGPGYTFSRIESIDPGEIAIVLESKIGHGMWEWILLHTSEKEKIGWIPQGMVEPIINLK